MNTRLLPLAPKQYDFTDQAQLRAILETIDASNQKKPVLGSFTPALTCITSGTITLSIASGRFIKSGQLVNIWFNCTASAISTPRGSVRMTGLPFTSENKVNQFGSGSMTEWSGITAGPIYTNLVPKISPNTAHAIFYGSCGPYISTNPMTGDSCTSATKLIGTLSYLAIS